jgi:hypothetical protein
MDDAFVSTILPTLFVGVDDEGDAQQQQGSLRDLFAMALSPQRHPGLASTLLPPSSLNFSASASTLALGSADDALLLLGSLEEDDLLGPDDLLQGDEACGHDDSDKTDQSILSVLLETHRDSADDDDSSISSNSDSSISSSSSSSSGDTGGRLVKNAFKSVVHDTPRSPRASRSKRSRISPRA